MRGRTGSGARRAAARALAGCAGAGPLRLRRLRFQSRPDRLAVHPELVALDAANPLVVPYRVIDLAVGIAVGLVGAEIQLLEAGLEFGDRRAGP